ncbi:MAG: SET domain-containing protein [Sphingobacteriaceae bacterium]|nr:MAG: SET domain-containing protein [Sphingobacteriaceae bacterium]
MTLLLPDSSSHRQPISIQKIQDIQEIQEIQEIRKNIAQCIVDPPVEVRPSKRHGNGVFATRDIESGMPVAYYDGEVLESGNIINMDQHEYSLEYPQSWLPGDTESLTCIGYKKPRTSYGCAQLINDSLCPELD